jgi:hypothetical protein
MPTYEFQNEKTGEVKEMYMTYDEKKDFLEKNPEWKYIIAATGISYHGPISNTRRAGSGWNDVLKGIKKASGKNNINHD